MIETSPTPSPWLTSQLVDYALLTLHAVPHTAAGPCPRKATSAVHRTTGLSSAHVVTPASEWGGETRTAGEESDKLIS